jgi:hypothetical protein
MVLAGTISQLKLHDLLNASRCSKQRLSVITQSHNHSTQRVIGSKIYVCFDATYYTEFLCRISTTSSIEVYYELLRYCKNQCIHYRTLIGANMRPIISDHTHRLSCMRSHSRLMETHPSVTGIGHYGIVLNPVHDAHMSLITL